MSREQLEVYKNSGNYYFHGSRVAGLSVLEPSQPVGQPERNAKSGVYAAYAYDVALFMAILKGSRCGWDTYMYPAPFGFYVVDEDLEKAQKEERRGSVYVVSRDEFDFRDPAVPRSSHKVPVHEEVTVSAGDLVLKEISLISKDWVYLGSAAVRGALS